MTASYKPPPAAQRYARFIPAEEIRRVTEWRFGAVDVHLRAAAEQAERLEAVALSEQSPSMLQKLESARQEAFAAGLAQGQQQEAAEAARRMDDYVGGTGREVAARLAALIAAAEAGMDQMQERIADSVIEMACDIARQVLRRELATDAAAALPVAREALDMLRADGRVATVRLDPLDLQSLRGRLEAEGTALPVSWIADESVGPGGCIVESAGCVIDGRLPARWKRAIAALSRTEAWDQPVEADAASTPASLPESNPPVADPSVSASPSASMKESRHD